MSQESEDKSFDTVVRCVAVVISILIASIAAYNAYTTYLYTSAGYTVESLPGQSTPQYTKH